MREVCGLESFAQGLCMCAKLADQGRGPVWIRRGILGLLLLSSVMLASRVAAAERSRPFRIGALTVSWGPTPMIVGMRDGLLALGYREDQDFVLGVRFTQGDIGALDTAARQLVAYGVDLLFVDNDASAKAAQQATSQIPIVFASVADPEGLGSIQSFARPGGNVTGVTDLELNLGPKRLQVFQEMIPHLKRVLFVYSVDEVYAVRMARVYGAAARDLGIKLITKGVQTQEEAQAVFADVRKGEVDGLLAPFSSALNIPGFIQETEAQQAIPAMHNSVFFVERGGLVSYAPDHHKTGKQAARLVDKILKGAKPAEIPVEVNAKIEFAINLKTAKALGLTIPPEVLFRADRVVR
jgi:putative ABC transport system substrate-binding protein